MTSQSDDHVEFDELIAMALAESTLGPEPRPMVRDAVLMRATAAAPLPAGFAVHDAADEETWRSYPIPGIRMKVLVMNTGTGYATLLLDVAPGVRFPPHHHSGDEQCFVVSGSVHTLGRHLRAGDFVYAHAGTDHEELWTEEGARVLLVVPESEVPL